MTKARTLADFISDGSPLADGTISVSEVSGAAPLASPTFTGGIDVTGTVTADGLTVDGNPIFKGYALVNEDGANTKQIYLRSDYSGNPAIQVATNHNLVFATNNTERMRIANNGDISFYEDTGTTPKFFWDASAESLGIGTSTTTGFDSGADDLIVGSGSASTGLTIFSGTSGYGSIHFADANSSPANYVGYVNYNHSTNSMQFATNSTEAMRIDSSGRVGIGTVPSTLWSSSYDALQVGLGGSVYAHAGAGSNMFMAANSVYEGTAPNYYDKYLTSSTASKYAQDSGYHTWSTAASGTAGNAITWAERMRIDSSGKLLVGTTDTALYSRSSGSGLCYRNGATLDVLTTNDSCSILNRAGTDGSIIDLRKNGTTVGSVGVLNSNNVTISGTVADHGGLQFGTHCVIPMEANADSNGTIDVGSADSRFKDGHFSGTVNAANFNTTSDATLKTNVETLTGSLDAVKSLRGVSYDWIESGGSEIGVIAQEVEAVLPDVVSTNDEGIKSVKYGNMVAVLIEAIKEQQLRIEALELKLGE